MISGSTLLIIQVLTRKQSAKRSTARIVPATTCCVVREVTMPSLRVAEDISCCCSCVPHGWVLRTTERGSPSPQTSVQNHPTNKKFKADVLQTRWKSKSEREGLNEPSAWQKVQDVYPTRRNLCAYYDATVACRSGSANFQPCGGKRSPFQRCKWSLGCQHAHNASTHTDCCTLQ